MTEVEIIKAFTDDVFGYLLQSDTYEGCVMELREVMRMEDEDDE